VLFVCCERLPVNNNQDLNRGYHMNIKITTRCFICLHLLFPVLGFSQNLVWPLSGTTEPDLPMSSSFGPRLLASEDFRYDFHRGLDIPASIGTPIYAVEAGTVRLAGNYSFYPNGSPLVQIRHTKEDGSFYYTNYLHLNSWEVEENQEVLQGDFIGTVGASKSGFKHLHFEIRDGGLNQYHCVHPFGWLPYTDTIAHSVTIDDVNVLDPQHPVVSLTVTLPPHELDLNRVEVKVYEIVKRRRTLVDTQSFDMNEWNSQYTDASILDNPDMNGILVSPTHFNASKSEYSVSFQFHNLSGGKKIEVEASATDVHGNSVTEKWRSSSDSGTKPPRK